MSNLPSISPIGSGATPNGMPINRVSGAAAAFKVGSVESASPPLALNATTELTPVPASADRVELSMHARLLTMLRLMPDVRQPLIDRVRAEIATGAYETDTKIDAAIENWAREEL